MTEVMLRDLDTLARSLTDEVYETPSARGMHVRPRHPPRNDPNSFPGQNEYLYTARAVILPLFAFMVGWGSEFSFARYGAFTSMLTGNLILVARNFLTGEGHGDSVLFYISVIIANLAGAYVYSFVRVFTPWAGTILMPFVVLLLTAGDLMWNWGSTSRWLACFLAPVFGAVNVMISYGPVGVTPTFATASMQKLAQFPPKRFAQRYKKKEYAEALLLIIGIIGLFTGVLFSGAFLYVLPIDVRWVEILMAIMFALLMPLHDFLFYKVLVDHLPADALPEEHLRYKVFRWCGEWEHEIEMELDNEVNKLYTSAQGGVRSPRSPRSPPSPRSPRSPRSPNSTACGC
mmetsp:Transcript_60936/g.145213  ORF Transcript_60936/g.145213 Transcript_60936/m.145213 type:complete len:345 (-) Transcript_60936:104-1138(-)